MVNRARDAADRSIAKQKLHLPEIEAAEIIEMGVGVPRGMVDNAKDSGERFLTAGNNTDPGRMPFGIPGDVGFSLTDQHGIA